MRGQLFDPRLLHLAGVSHKLYHPENFASDILVLKLLSQRTIKKLGKLGDGDGVDVAVVCVTLYFVRLHLHKVNVKELPCEERTVYHWDSVLWLTIFDRCEKRWKKT